MYRRSQQLDDMKSAKCDKCDSNRLLYKGGKIICNNCGEVLTTKYVKKNKYGAKKTEFNGKIFDSKFEAGIAQQLEIRKKLGEITDYDTQYKVIIPLYNKDGKVVKEISHKVDFRLHFKDGSFELLEAKGLALPDWKWRRMLLENIWLMEHKNYSYAVVYQSGNRK